MDRVRGSRLVGALPVLGLFGIALLPASLILLAHGKSTATRVRLGGLLVAATILIVFVLPLLYRSAPV